MKIAVFGASGMIGSRIVAEAAARGHQVTSISRSGGDLAGNASDPAFTAAVAADHDVIVSAVGPSRTEDDGDAFAATIANLAATLSGKRLLVVGGAGSLEVDGVRLVDTPEFPDLYKSEALKGAASLQVLRDAADDVDWTYLSPSPVIEPGPRGEFRLGLYSPAGDRVTTDDYAAALLDEIEQPAHRRRRFTVASL